MYAKPLLLPPLQLARLQCKWICFILQPHATTPDTDRHIRWCTEQDELSELIKCCMHHLYNTYGSVIWRIAVFTERLCRTSPTVSVDLPTLTDVAVSGRPSQTRWLSRQQTVQHSMTAHSQWLRRGCGTVCLHWSGAEDVLLLSELLVPRAVLDSNCTNVPAPHFGMSVTLFHRLCKMPR